jgi:hypothetical protein
LVVDVFDEGLDRTSDYYGQIAAYRGGDTGDTMGWTPNSSQFSIDHEAPTSTAALACALPGNDGWCRSATAAASISAVDAGCLANVEWIRYNLNASGDAIYSGEISISGEGIHVLAMWSSDGVYGPVGEETYNTETPHSEQYQIDSVAPAVAPISTCVLPGTNGWCRSLTVDYALTPSDETSGIGTAMCTVDGEGPYDARNAISVAGDAAHTLDCTVNDVAGNTTTETAAINIDSTPPENAAVIDCGEGNNGWCIGSATVTINPTDETSGLATATCDNDGTVVDATFSFTVEGDGERYLDCEAVDNAGNIAHWTIPIKIDTEDPYPDPLVECDHGNDPWCLSDAQVYINPADDTSGVELATCTLDGGATVYTVSASDGIWVRGDGEHTLNCTGQDYAGHEVFWEWNIYIDTTPPDDAPTVECEEGDDGWCVTPATITLNPSDVSSGVATAICTIDGGSTVDATTSFTVSADGEHTIDCDIEDVAGNHTDDVFDVAVDTTPPTLSLEENDGQGECIAVDEASGIAVIEYRLPNNGVNWTVYTEPFDWPEEVVAECRASDNAGNTSSTSEQAAAEPTPTPEPEDTTMYIAGYVYNTQGLPLSNVNVQIFRSGQLAWAGQTDYRGYFETNLSLARSHSSYSTAFASPRMMRQVKKRTVLLQYGNIEITETDPPGYTSVSAQHLEGSGQIQSANEITCNDGCLVLFTDTTSLIQHL